LADVANGNLSFGEPALESSLNDGIYTVDKPSELPLSQYAKDGKQIILLGTTLRSLAGFYETFLWPKAEAGIRLTFLLVSQSLFLANGPLLEQVAIRHGRSPDEVLRQLETTSAELNQMQAAHPGNVSVFRLPVLPTFGQTVVDPFLPSKKMRISFYLHQPPSECNLALHIKPSTSESAEVFERFLAHYVRLSEAARSWAGTDLDGSRSSRGNANGVRAQTRNGGSVRRQAPTKPQSAGR
jgi:hypothetical protein